jgi:hypothetical protein
MTFTGRCSSLPCRQFSGLSLKGFMMADLPRERTVGKHQEQELETLL